MKRSDHFFDDHYTLARLWIELDLMQTRRDFPRLLGREDFRLEFSPETTSFQVLSKLSPNV